MSGSVLHRPIVANLTTTLILFAKVVPERHVSAPPSTKAPLGRVRRTQAPIRPPSAARRSINRLANAQRLGIARR